jgi:LPXTG-motif cell wall-anchored protein
MATNTVQGPMLFIKKLWGLLYIVLGCLGIAIGYETGSPWLIAAGIVALVVGVSLLALKVIRRNALQ